MSTLPERSSVRSERRDASRETAGAAGEARSLGCWCRFSVLGFKCLVLFLVCLPVGAISLTLQSPVYTPCGNVSINGVAALSAGEIITDISWSWGDGNTSHSLLPAAHKYFRNGTFAVQVMATSQAGDMASASTSVAISNAIADTTCPSSIRFPTRAYRFPSRTRPTRNTRSRETRSRPSWPHFPGSL